MRAELAAGVYSPLSRPLQAQIIAMAERQEQGILFINRRGFRTFVLCRSCGAVLMCPHCDVSLTFHLSDQLLRCHHCGYLRAELAAQCSDCGSEHFKYFGTGTQRIEQAVQALFPDLKLLRFDQDTTQNKGAHQRILKRFAQGEADLLIGTQMLTKGLDLPRVTLTGVLAADSLLHMPDFRCGERALQLLTQVAGRAGRAEHPGQVILQTYDPDHPVVQAVLNHDYGGFAQRELKERQSLNYPPFGQLVSFLWQGEEQDQVIKAAQQTIEAMAHWPGEVLGPAPALIPKIQNKYRWQALWKIPLTTKPQVFLTQIRSSSPYVVLKIDVDPVHLG